MLIIHYIIYNQKPDNRLQDSFNHWYFSLSSLDFTSNIQNYILSCFKCSIDVQYPRISQKCGHAFSFFKEEIDK